jgi:cytochrome c5
MRSLPEEVMLAVVIGALAVAGCRGGGPGAGSVTAAAAPAVSATPGMDPGESVWKQNCEKCHGAGGLGDAPPIGDKAAWGTRIGQGTDMLLRHALDGFTGSTGEMPPRGGNPSLSDEQVGAALTFMLGQVR